MESKSPPDIGIPSIVKAELYFGANKSSKKDEVIQVLDNFLVPFFIVPFDNKASYAYAYIHAQLESQGNLIGPNDLIIAATALSNGSILVTHNIKEFGKLEGLQTEDWTK